MTRRRNGFLIAVGRPLLAALMAATLALAFTGLAGARVPQTPRISSVFVSASGATLAQLDRGATGEGAVLYTTGSRVHPEMVVRIRNDAAHHSAVAEVFQTPPRTYYVPYHRTGGHIELPPRLKPVITVTAAGGWWVRGGKANWNLDLYVGGGIRTMWQDYLYRNALPPSSRMFHVFTRADSSGLPKWDLRQLIPRFPGDAVLRTNYAARECAPPRTVVPSISPGWPYVTTSGSFEQLPNQLRPPIVLNPDYGRISTFSEVVSVREQSCSYDFYSIHRLSPNIVNAADFESPWGLYDLSGRNPGYPNLLIRTEHYFANDPWLTAVDYNAFVGNALLARPTEVVRYSWADHPGNLDFDYKVDVLGFHPYTSTVSLAGGRLRVRAPPYRQYPSWVIGKRWPVTTFVDAVHNNELSSEGIYAWSARSIGTTYWRGWTSRPDLSQFETIPEGMRGEYRLQGSSRPILYASPLDGRLHLLNAARGLWSVDRRTRMLERNLAGGPYIDDWQTQVRASPSGPWKSREELAAVDGFLLYSGPSGAIIRRVIVPMESFRTLPPTDAASWNRFRTIAAPYRRGKPAGNLESWMAPYPGNGLTVPTGTVASPTAVAHGFQLRLTVPPGSVLSGALPGLPGQLRPGTYVLSYDTGTARWTATLATSPRIQLRLLNRGPIRAHLDNVLRIAVHNEGSEGWSGVLRVSVAGQPLASEALSIPGKGTIHVAVPWSPAKPGIIPVRIRAGGSLRVRHMVVGAIPRPSTGTMLSVSSPSSSYYIPVFLLLLVLIAGSFVLWNENYGPA